MLKRFCILICVLVMSLIAAPVSASAQSCVRNNQIVTLEGVVTISATFMSPRDFPWAPKNGFVSYPVLVINTPVCLNDDGQFSPNVRVLQLSSGNLPNADALRKGVAVRVKGTLFSEHTAHHYTPVLVSVSELTILN